MDSRMFEARVEKTLSGTLIKIDFPRRTIWLQANAEVHPLTSPTPLIFYGVKVGDHVLVTRRMDGAFRVAKDASPEKDEEHAILIDEENPVLST